MSSGGPLVFVIPSQGTCEWVRCKGCTELGVADLPRPALEVQQPLDSRRCSAVAGSGCSDRARATAAALELQLDKGTGCGGLGRRGARRGPRREQGRGLERGRARRSGEVPPWRSHAARRSGVAASVLAEYAPRQAPRRRYAPRAARAACPAPHAARRPLTPLAPPEAVSPELG